MKNKIDKYIDLATKVHLANVPFDKSEAETLLKENKCGTAQNYFKRFIHYFGKHYIMTTTSIIALILAGLYLGTPTETASSSALAEPAKATVMQKAENNATAIETTANNISEKENISTSKNLKGNAVAPVDTLDQTKNPGYYDGSEPPAKSETVLTEEFDESELNWELVVFDHEEWYFQWINCIEKKNNYDKYGNHSVSVSYSYSPLDDYATIKILKQLEDSISFAVEPAVIKSICNLEVSEYFTQLADICVGIFKEAKDERLVNMVSLYANLNRKIINNPAEYMKIKSKGLTLPKQTLDKLGVMFTDSTISIPQDELIQNNKKRNAIIRFFQTDKIDTLNLPDDDFLIKKNIIFEWSNKYFNIAVRDSNKRLPFSLSQLRNRQDFDTLSINKSYGDKSKIGLSVQSYYDIFGIFDPQEYRKVCPPHIANVPEFRYDAILNFSNEDSKKLYDYASKMEATRNDYRMYVTAYSEMEKNHLFGEYSKNFTVYKNMFTGFKYKYLIPVNIQIPYTETQDPKQRYITLWYFPNEEFMSALPQDIRTQLEKEISIASKILKGEIQPEEACEEVGEKESLLGLCNLTDKAIANLTLYPNPASSNINVRFDLLDKRYYKVMLTDATGNYLKDLTDWIASDKAEIKQNFDLSELQNGTYLMQVVTEKGEKLLSKFNISR